MKEIFNLNKNSVVFILSIFMSTIAPGYLFIYLYQPVTFFKADWLSLLMLAVAVTLPIYAINVVVKNYYLGVKRNNLKKPEDPNDLYINISDASILSAITNTFIFYFSFINDIFINCERNTKFFIGNIIFCCAAAILMDLIRTWYFSNKNKRDSKKNKSITTQNT